MQTTRSLNKNEEIMTMNKTESFTFHQLPTSVAELQAMPEAALKTPFQTAALTVAVLCHYEIDPQVTIEMLNVLKGPQALSPYDIQFLRDRLSGKGYKACSFFRGATPENNYTPTEPLTITVSSGPYSFQEKGYANLLIQSSGADSPRQIKMREKPSSGEWFLWENYLLADIRTPVASDPWA
ncbi:MAG: hypothetical protein M0P44_05070 [Clostridiales bacterium]|jgi:hypothetical protein|nr:hypothetical protein [Clostridiales bacterium]